MVGGRVVPRAGWTSGRQAFYEVAAPRPQRLYDGTSFVAGSRCHEGGPHPTNKLESASVPYAWLTFLVSRCLQSQDGRRGKDRGEYNECRLGDPADDVIGTDLVVCSNRNGQEGSEQREEADDEDGEDDEDDNNDKGDDEDDDNDDEDNRGGGEEEIARVQQ
ncbi:hypothetical protein NHX12_032010 [Muraenolepis orangiensis]|uniref:Uncharacterized protein n=1 Tax=Muraenolepis orangiensis TaxID=630683 RepID=A0A9Q0EAQ2_9TELE|nr:hypothetical protein NHX12_032010 [Muraenolepis orangiensis]